MAQMNIRNVPDDLLKRAKIAAIEGGITLRELVLKAVEAALREKGKPRR